MYVKYIFWEKLKKKQYKSLRYWDVKNWDIKQTFFKWLSFSTVLDLFKICFKNASKFFIYFYYRLLILERDLVLDRDILKT